MKKRLYLTLLFASVLVCNIATAQNKDKAYKAFYKRINKGFSLPETNSATKDKSTNEPKCLDSLKSNIELLESVLDKLERETPTTRPEREISDRPEKRYIFNPTEKNGEKAKFTPSPTVQPKEATPKPTSRLSIEKKETPNTSTPTATPQKRIESTPVAPAIPSLPSNAQVTDTKDSKNQQNKSTGVISASGESTTSLSKLPKPEVRIATARLESGDPLKKYNVVIVTLSSIQRSNRLKAILYAETNEKIRIARSEENLHHFILGSFDTEEEAIDKRNSIIEHYTSKHNIKELMSKYGIPFTDTWILVTE